MVTRTLKIRTPIPWEMARRLTTSAESILDSTIVDLNDYQKAVFQEQSWTIPFGRPSKSSMCSRMVGLSQLQRDIAKHRKEWPGYWVGT